MGMKVGAVAMRAEQLALIQTSFQQVLSIEDTAVELFCARLFELDPSLWHVLSKGDIGGQGRRILTAIDEVIHNLNNCEQIRPVRQRHAKWPELCILQESHYETAGAALLWTLEMGLGEDFTQETKAPGLNFTLCLQL
jgi:hemoglobin-like flavoprotein